MAEPFGDLAQGRKTPRRDVDGREREAGLSFQKPEKLAAGGGAGIENPLSGRRPFQQGRDGELRGHVLNRDPAVVESRQRGGGLRLPEDQPLR